MSDIDMQSYMTGAIPSSAAENLPITPSYNVANDSEDYPVHPEFLSQPEEAPVAQQEPIAAEKESVSQQEWNFRALREEMDRKQARIQELERNYDLLRMPQQQHNHRQEEPQNMAKRPFDMDKSEIPNVGEIEAAWQRQESVYAQRESALKSQMEELLVAQKHADYAEVLEKYTAPLLKQKPHLAEGIYGASNKALFAYELGKLAQQQQQQTQQAPQVAAPSQGAQNAQRMVDNARKPRTMAQAGGQSVLSQADRFATMSDKDFMEFASRNLDY